MKDNTIIVKKINEVYFKLQTTSEQAYELRSYFEVFVENYKFNPKYKAKLWSGKISFYSIIEQTLPIGLLDSFIKFCKQFEYKYILDFAPSELYNFITDDEYNKIKENIFKDSKFELRAYQDYAFRELITKKRGVILYATGSGKSLILYSVIKHLANITEGRILLIVPSVSLTQQLSSDFREYGWDNFFDSCGLIFSGSDHNDTTKKLVISTWQSLQNRPAEFFEDFEVAIADECHGAKSVEMQKILKKLTRASFRIGCTGTLSDEPINNLTIHGLLGPKIAEVKSEKLIEEGVLAPVKIINVLMKYPQEMIVKSGETYNEEVEKTLYYPDRKKVLKYIISNVSEKHNILILVHRIEHLDQTEEYIKKNFGGRKIYKISGKTEASTREDIRQRVNKEEGSIIIATYKTLSTGVNIPKLHHVIFWSSYKSKIVVLQSLGRSLRQHDSKKVAVIWDCIDDLSWKKSTGTIGTNHLYKHFIERKKYYKEQNFPTQTIELYLEKLDK